MLNINVLIYVTILLASYLCNIEVAADGFAKLGDVRYQLTIQEIFGDRKPPEHFCAATAIDRDWVLSAGHCAAEINKPSRINDFVVGAGKIRSCEDENTQQIRGIHAVYIHEKYEHRVVRLISAYDIALMKLNESLISNKFIKPIALPKENEQIDTTAVVSGWNFIHNRDMRMQGLLHGLKVATLNVHDTNTCVHKVQRINIENDILIYPDQIAKNLICAGPFVSIYSVCCGDSGGPLVKIKKYGKKVIMGIVSYIERIGSEGSYNEGISVFVNVSAHLHWIKRIMNHY